MWRNTAFCYSVLGDPLMGAVSGAGSPRGWKILGRHPCYGFRFLFACVALSCVRMGPCTLENKMDKSCKINGNGRTHVTIYNKRT